MARSEKTTVDYFPFLCKEGKAMYYIETKYGNDGYATWVKLLRQLAVTSNHYLNLKDKIELKFIAAKCNVSEAKLINIIVDLCEMGEMNTELWQECNIVFSEKFIENIQDAYKKRNNHCITLVDLRILLQGLGILKQDKSTPKVSGNPHTILDDSISENTIPENSIEKDKGAATATPPPTPTISLKEREKAFFDSLTPYVKDYGREMLRAFYNHWSQINPGGKKMWFEMQKTFELSKRLQTWKANDIAWNKEGKGGAAPENLQQTFEDGMTVLKATRQ
ncbi:MAG: DUF4373 domain-containing protein [Cytophagaceae bacterium]|nr:DUF4373 domain-containing protein [Cytophagaceae bacterium]